MSVPHPGGDPNANFYAQLKRDVLDRLPQITTVELIPDDIEAKQLRARFDPARLNPSTGPESPELSIKWYRQEPHDWFRINYPTRTRDFTRGGTRTRTIPISDERISSIQPAMRRIAGESRLNTRPRR